MSKRSTDQTAPPGLSYKYQRLRERLRRAVESGELAGKLPGERELSRRYSANAKTMNKALTDLATEGLLVRHVGRGTFVAHDAVAKPGRDPTRSMTFGYVIPADGVGPWAQELHCRTASILHELGHEFEQLAIPADVSAELNGRQLSADRLRALDGLALFGLRPAASFLACAAREHLPLVMVANRHEQARTAAVLVDYAQGAFELCQYLIHLGHREIRLCVDPALMPAAGGAEQGYRAAMLRNGLQPRPTCDANSVLATGESARPSAVICIGSNSAALIAKGAAVGARGPLSLCCIPEPCDLMPARQHITSYEVDADRIARWIAELLVSASPTRWQQVVIVPGMIVERGSTAPEVGPVQTLSRPGVAEC